VKFKPQSYPKKKNPKNPEYTIVLKSSLWDEWQEVLFIAKLILLGFLHIQVSFSLCNPVMWVLWISCFVDGELCGSEKWWEYAHDNMAWKWGTQAEF
jgi:hypothetical protein